MGAAVTFLLWWLDYVLGSQGAGHGWHPPPWGIAPGSQGRGRRGQGGCRRHGDNLNIVVAVLIVQALDVLLNNKLLCSVAGPLELQPLHPDCPGWRHLSLFYDPSHRHDFVGPLVAPEHGGRDHDSYQHHYAHDTS